VAIVSIQFRDPAPVIGSSYSRTKHSREYDVQEKGAWIILVPKGNGPRHRVPIANVVSITEDNVVEVAK
jgi:hypothetical protein